MSAAAVVRTARSGHITTVTLDRADHLNAISAAMLDQLVAAIEDAHHDPDTWVVVLRAEGTRAFCVGRDLVEARARDTTDLPADSLPMRGRLRNVFEVMTECVKPIVAGIFGHTLGGGAELALASDIRIAADDLSFGFPEVKRGFGANFASVALARAVAPCIANDLLFTGRVITAEEALGLQLVNRVVPSGDLDETVRRYAADLVTNAPLSMRRYKAMATRAQGLPLAAALRLDAAPNPYLSEDRREGVAAFLEKRTPRWAAQ